MTTISRTSLMAVVSGILMVVSMSGHAQLADRLKCIPSKSMICSIDGCHEDNSSNLTFKVDIRDGVYRRCDATGCEPPFNVKVSERGNHLKVSDGLNVFMSIQRVEIQVETVGYAEPAGMFADMAVSGVATILNYGKCSLAK